METVELRLETSGRPVVDLTGDLVHFCAGRGDGLAHAFCPHATAALVLMELGAGSEQDLLAWIDMHLPRDDSYHHRHGSRGHGADHLMPAVFGASVLVPVRAGRPGLGSWQSLALLDTNRENNFRTVRLSFLPG